MGKRNILEMMDRYMVDRWIDRNLGLLWLANIDENTPLGALKTNISDKLTSSMDGN